MNYDATHDLKEGTYRTADKPQTCGTTDKVHTSKIPNREKTGVTNSNGTTNWMETGGPSKKDFPKNLPAVMRKVSNWKNLHFYKKTVVLYLLTDVFCRRFLPKHGDRTVDQMVQAARSGKQNIVEGTEDGKTSSAMELNLLNVARGSLQELREDYEDFVGKNRLILWQKGHPRYDKMLDFCRNHDDFAAYAPFADKWTAEEFCNTALTLCHLVDKMMCTYLDHLQKRFVTEGGVKERMYAARTGYRKQQDALLARLRAENPKLQAENKRLVAENRRLQEENRRLQAECAKLETENKRLKQ